MLQQLNVIGVIKWDVGLEKATNVVIALSWTLNLSIARSSISLQDYYLLLWKRVRLKYYL